MKRLDYRILIGAVLILGGVLMLLDQLNILKGALEYFWAGLLGLGALIFLYIFVSDRRKWWAAIPAFTLAGLAASSLLLDRLGWGGFALLGGIGLGFWAIYLSNRSHWWAIIPGGVLITLGLTSAMGESGLFNAGSVFFVGLGVTFLLVALLARMQWAYIPAVILLLLGFFLSIFLGTPLEGLLQYVWIGVLLLAGISLVVSSLTSKKS